MLKIRSKDDMIRTDPSVQTIKGYVENNSLHRNSFLESLIKIILSCENGRIIDIDGDWGSGKTVLIKELELLTEEQDMRTPDIEQKYIKRLKDNYSIFYYNAWENDQYDPAESVVFSLISN